MTKLWAKMVDTDGDGILEVLQLSETDPATLFTPEACQSWKEVPAGTQIGSVQVNGKWKTGGDWLEEKLSKAPPPPDEAAPVKRMNGEVLQVEIVDSGANYEIPFVRDQYDIEDGVGLVVEVIYNEMTNAASEAVIHNPGNGYKIGQEFKVKGGHGRTWDNKNPTYTVVRITAVHTATE